MHFVIAGRINCFQFTYAVMVAQRLKENLPDFTYLKIAKKPEDWNRWLVEICKQNDWHHIKSPLIWREIGLKQGKKDFIGDINKFLDICYDYYGIPQDILSAEHFNRGEMAWFTQRTESEFFENIQFEAKNRREYRSRQVCITRASSQMSEIIVAELLQIDLQKRENGLEIRLFDEPKNICKLLDKAMDAKQCPGSSGFGNCRVVHNMKEAFSNVDLVIVLDFFPRKHSESLVKWLKRNRNAMCILGKALNMYAPSHCRVIIGSPSTQPICYNATVLASFATRLHVRNIVAVTQDLGRETLKLLAEKTKKPLKDFYCPPVWGFIGLNKYIDIRRTLHTNLYKVPGRRPNSTLPQGTEEYELRTSECLLIEKDADELFELVVQHKAHTLSQLGRSPYLTKVTAILDLLKVWGLKQEDGNGEILCLGVYSDGTFKIPRGIYWSQPVILKDGFWVPFKDFPVPRSNYFNMYYLFLFSIAAVYRTKVKPRIYIPPERIPKPKEKKKLDFDKILEGVGMPAIKSDTECAIYLKYLSKHELGIDFDEVMAPIEEEVESEVLASEEVMREQIYCECWRQELKELQKIAFDCSSTTEVEVNLSDIISGSEWSVINALSAPGGKNSKEDVLVGNKSDHADLVSPPSTINFCEKLPSSSAYPRLRDPVKGASSEGEGISTENFYKQQNAQIFEEDLKDVIYADTYPEGKHITFDSDAKGEDETAFQVKFYGKKNAVRDKDADMKMQKRISKYERGGEDSVEEELEKIGEKKDSLAESGKTQDSFDTEFQISKEGTPFEIIRDQRGLDSLEEMQSKGSGKDSSETFKEIYTDDVTPIIDPASIQFVPPNKDISTESSEKNLSFAGEEQYVFQDSFKSTAEISGEKIIDQYSMTTLEEDLQMVWGEQTETEEEVEKETEKPKKRRREGIPLCCLCRCLVPEGLPCCPCGATTVVEVFKKESVEIIIQSEDDINYTVEYFETALKSESEELQSESEELQLESEELQSESDFEESEKEEEPKQLPPESFLPFSPKPKNVFKGAVRPYELTKEYADSFNKTEIDIPKRCSELLEEAKVKLEEMKAEKGEEEEKNYDTDKESFPPICEDIDHIKTDFSDLKLLVPCGLEDWRLTVQKKYREWFFQGPKINDDTYYDVGIEEVSEDEFEIDKELEQFFEK